jgi:hypothetical protein
MKLSTLLVMIIFSTLLINSFCGDSAFSTYNFNDFETSYLSYNNEQGLFHLKSLESRPIKTPQFSTFLGKGFLEKIKSSVPGWFNQAVTSKPEKFKIRVDSPEDIQMLVYYLSYPPAEAPLLGKMTPKDGEVKINTFEYEFTEKSNFYQIINLLVTGWYTIDLESVLGFFEANTKMTVPKEAQKKLNDRLDAVKEEFGDQTKIVKTVDDLKKKIDDLFTKQILNSSVDEAQKAKNQQGTTANNSKNTLLPVVPEVNRLSDFKINGDEIIYTFTDETTHVFTQGEDVFVVDAGAQVLINGVGLLLTTPNYQNVHIFITHFHLDHVQGLAGLIQKEFNDKKKVTLHIHEVLSAEFVGWASQNWEIIGPYGQEKKFTLEVLNDAAPKDKPYPFKNNKLESKHFIASTSWIFPAQPAVKTENNQVQGNNQKTNDGVCTKIFTGDFNAQVGDNQPQLRQDGVKGYFEHIQSIIDQTTCAYVFWDWGHFIAGSTPDTYKHILDDAKYAKLKYIWEHEKNNKGFILKKINLETAFSSSKHVYVENANSIISSPPSSTTSPTNTNAIPQNNKNKLKNKNNKNKNG